MGVEPHVDPVYDKIAKMYMRLWEQRLWGIAPQPAVVKKINLEGSEQMVMTRRERAEIRERLTKRQFPPDQVPFAVVPIHTLASLLDTADHFEQKYKELQAVIDNAIAVMQAAE